MAQQLVVAVGQCSDRGRKDENQDFHGAVLPTGAELSLKGVAVALADGISTSPVSRTAAETAVKSFLTDYYCTSASWSVRTAARSVITATNAWLHSETRRNHEAHDLDRGYVCTFSALVLKGRTAYLFHAGDSRISRVVGDTLEPLTSLHRVVMSAQESYLGRALGMADAIDLECNQVPVEAGDVFVLATDGVHEFVSAREQVALMREHAGDLQSAAQGIVQRALAAGSDDNLTVQLVRVESLPDGDALEHLAQAEDLPVPEVSRLPVMIDGYQLVRQLHANERSQVYLALDQATGERVAFKVPAQSLREHPALLRQFAMEEWIARRVVSPHVLGAHPHDRARTAQYVVLQYVEGPSLRQWMHDHPRPALDEVRGIVEQMVKGLRAMHRREMIHCDLRPENVLIDRDGTARLIDFGSVRVTGLVEAADSTADAPVLGTVQYTAPEWLAGEAPTWRSDLYSLAAIAYEMLAGRLPYGASAGRVRTPEDQRRLRYRPIATGRDGIPAWVDGALRKALHPDPLQRYEAMSEFMHDLQVPNSRFVVSRSAPLLERDPVLFWKGLAMLLGVLLVFSLVSGR